MNAKERKAKQKWLNKQKEYKQCKADPNLNEKCCQAYNRDGTLCDRKGTIQLDLTQTKDIKLFGGLYVKYSGGINCCFFCPQHAKKLSLIYAAKAAYSILPAYFTRNMTFDEYLHYDPEYLDEALKNFKNGTPYGIDILELKK